MPDRDWRFENAPDRSSDASNQPNFDRHNLWSGVSALSEGSSQSDGNVSHLDFSANPYPEQESQGRSHWNSGINRHHDSYNEREPSSQNNPNSDLLVNKLLSDPTMTQTLEGAAAQLSPQGLATLEQSLGQSLAMNPYTNDAVLAQQAIAQMTQEGASASDLSAMQNVYSALAGSTAPSTGTVGDTTVGTTNPSPVGDTTGTTTPISSSGAGDTTPTATGSSGAGDSTATSTGSSGTGDSTPTATGSSAAGDSTPTSTESSGAGDSTATATGSGAANGSNGAFTTEGSQIIGPNGQPFVAKGVDIGVNTALQDFNQVTSELPGLNMIRLNAVPGQDSTANIQRVINEYTAKGIVVELEDHNDNGTFSTGSLSGDEQWYSQLASANTNNPYVWFGTPNEPQGSDTSANEIGIYNAIRSAGNNNPVMLEEGGGYQQNVVQQDLSSDPSMKNVIDDFHFYDTSSNPSDGTNYIQSQVSEANSLGIPILVGEFGNAMNGENVDPAGNQMTQDMIQENQQAGVGALVWNWSNGSPGSEADNMVANSAGTSFTNFGQMIANWIND